MNRIGFRSKVTLIGFLIIAGFFLLTEHTAHVFGILPFLFLLACPLMHIFTHGGHGGQGGDGGHKPSGEPGAASSGGGQRHGQH